MIDRESEKPARTPSSWELRIDGFNPLTERVVESLLAVSNGLVGSQSSLPEGSSVSNPATFIAGVYDSTNAVPELVVAPDWLAVDITIEGQPLLMERGKWLTHRRRLDFQRGTVLREWRHRDPSGRITRVLQRHAVSLADRSVLLQEIEIEPENYSGRVVVELRIAMRGEPLGTGPMLKLNIADDGRTLVGATSQAGAAVAFSLSCNADFGRGSSSILQSDSAIGQRWEWDAYLGSTYRFTKVVEGHRSTDLASIQESATDREKSDFLVLRKRHEDCWAERWSAANIQIAGNDEHQRAMRFAIYHLIGAVNPDDERISIAARGLTGESYKGHVFWDTDIFLTPFYIATQPRAARSLLMYRYHTLPAARAKAARLGYQGALYAWESAGDGEEVTPDVAHSLSGEVIPIWTGRRAHHISADVAYAVWQYWQATQDVEFFLRAGAEILLETARFWASRATLENDGRCHIRCVIGPDEYHESVDDNAYTNGLARWNLRTAADTLTLLMERWPGRWSELRQQLNISVETREEWRIIADRLVDGLDTATGLFEQFDGYHGREEVDLTEFEPRDVPMDVLLGRDRTERSKVIKQADVLMLLFLLRDAYAPFVLETNFDYYEPRTGHGSSLSPGIHAALAARLGYMGLAERYFSQTAAIDLDDRMGNAAGGIHMAAQGSLWQAAVFGFAGVQWLADALVIDPRLPESWQRLDVPLLWRGRSLRLSFDASAGESTVQLLDGGELFADMPNGEHVTLQVGQHRRASIDGRWTLKELQS